MDCPTEAVLVQFAAGELTLEDADRVVNHLAECSRCAAIADRAAAFEAPLASALTLPYDEGDLIGEIGVRVGDKVGPYELMEQIGSGGMGVVYVARQREPIRRKVALKVIKPGTDTREVIARFEAERRTLAMMDHPNIAGVLDAGSTESGLPFFVMELVRGKPITTFCDEKTLSSHERLQLFMDVCQAVQHAHQKGIIHRDIKPQNVLVTVRDDKPIPKIIDFGVAKALHQESGPGTVYTRFSQLIGTPLYMSPEQADLNAADIDTRSDIYSLGVLLYELLTGQTPLDRERMKQAAFDELRRMIREDDPPRPSTRLSSLGETGTEVAANRATQLPDLSRLVRGDLDWVVMRALEKDRSRRYETALGFARDIQRFLDHEPVAAGPPGSLYRMRKFIRRNRVWVTTGSLVFAALLVGTVSATLAMLSAFEQQARADAAATRAEEQAETAREAVQRMLTAVGDRRLRDVPRMDGLRRQLLEEALAFNQRFLEDSNSQEDRLEVGRAYLRIADIYSMLEKSVDAAKARREAASCFREMLKADQGAADPAYWLAETQRRTAAAHIEADEPRPAETLLRSCIASFDEQSAANEDSTRATIGAAISRRMLGSMLRREGRTREAEQSLVDSLAGLATLSADDATFRLEHAATLVAFGELYLGTKRQSEALESFEAALTTHKRLRADLPDRTHREALADNQERLGSQYRRSGDHARSRAAFRAAIVELRQLAREFPQIPQYRADVGRCQQELAIAIAMGADMAGSDRMFEEAERQLRTLCDEFPDVGHFHLEHATALRRLAVHKLNMNEGERARQPLLDALSALQEVVDRAPEVTAYGSALAETHFLYAVVLLRVDRKASESLMHLRSAVQIAERLADQAPDETVVRHRLAKYVRLQASLARDAGRFQESEGGYRRAIDIQRYLLTVDTGEELPRQLAITLNDLSKVMADQDKWPAAEGVSLEALEIRTKNRDRFPGRFDHPFEMAMSHSLLTRIYNGKKEYQKAVEHADACRRLSEELLEGTTYSDQFQELLLRAVSRQTRAYLGLNDLEAAEANIVIAENSFSKHVAPVESTPERLLEQVLEAMGRRASYHVVKGEPEKAVAVLDDLTARIPRGYAGHQAAAIAAMNCAYWLSDDPAEADRFRSIAVERLRKAVDAGYESKPEFRLSAVWRPLSKFPEFIAFAESLEK